MFLFPYDEATQVLIRHALKILGKEEAMEKKTLSPVKRSHKGRVRITDRKSSARVQVSHGQGKAGEGSQRVPARAEEERHSRLTPAELGSRDRGWARPVVEPQQQEPAVGSKKERFPVMLLFFPRSGDRWSQQAGVEGWMDIRHFSHALSKQ